MDKRVVITGMGAITPVGNSVAELWNSLVNGVCGVGLITEFPTDDLPAKVAGEVKNFNPADYGIEPAFARKQDKFSVFAVAAASEAIKQSGLVASDGEDGNIDPMRFGVYVGSGIGGFSTQYKESEKMIKDGPKWISPLFIPTMIANMAAGNIAIRYNLCGPCIPVVTACATSTHTVGEAYRAIRHGYADAIIAGGSEAATIPLGIAGFANAKALSRSEDPNYASLPFNANRGGFVMGEGAAMLVLEEYEHAKARGAKIIAEVCGYGNTCDAYHMTAPRTDCKTQAAAVRMALEEAGYNSSDVLHINAHGTGTSLNDSLETKTFKLALGDDAYKAHICSTKSMTGHLLGAAGAVEAAFCVMSVKEDIVPPTINHAEGDDDPEIDNKLNFTFNKAQKRVVNAALSNTFGFGGHNACAIVKKFRK